MWGAGAAIHNCGAAAEAFSHQKKAGGISRRLQVLEVITGLPLHLEAGGVGPEDPCVLLRLWAWVMS